jgi:poly(A) polymerase
MEHESGEPLLQLLRAICAAGARVFVIGAAASRLAANRDWNDMLMAVDGSWAAATAAVAHVPRVTEESPDATAPEHRFAVEGKRFRMIHLPRNGAADESTTLPAALRGVAGRARFSLDSVVLRLDQEGRREVIMDPSGGIVDAARRVLRCADAPAALVEAEPLFALEVFSRAALEGYAIDEELLAAIAGASAWRALPVDAFRETLLTVLNAAKPSTVFAAMQRCGVLAQFFPELDSLAGVDQRSVEYPDGVKNFHHKDVFHHTLKVLDNLCHNTADPWLRLSALLHDIAKPKTKAFRADSGWTFHGHAEAGARMTTRIFRRLGLPEEHLPFVRKMVALHLRPIALVREGVTDSAIRRLQADAGDDSHALLLLCRADITSKNPALVRRFLRNYEVLRGKMEDVLEGDRLRLWQPPLSGEDIMALCGLEPGIAVGVLKARIENAILDGIIPNTRDAAEDYLRRIQAEVLASTVLPAKSSRKKTLKRLPDSLMP